MKLIFIVIVITLVLYSVWASARQPTAAYTADQVITVVRDSYPSCYDGQEISDEEPRISVNFIGGTQAVWEVNIDCSPDSITASGSESRTVRKKMYFYESDGSLRERYYP